MDFEPATPTTGVSFTKEDIEIILASLDPPLLLRTWEPTKLGWNNKVYLLETQDGQRLVLKAGGRYWKRQKTEAEVAGMMLMRHYSGPNSSNVPRLVAFSSIRSRGSLPIKHEWVLQERAEGNDLTTAWGDLNDLARLDVTRQLAGIVVSMKSISPSRFGGGLQIGNFSLTTSHESEGHEGHEHVSGGHPEFPIYISNVLNGPPPTASYVSYIRTMLESEINSLKGSLSRKVYSIQLHDTRIPKLENFARNISQIAILRRIECDIDWRPIFTHGDFQPQNIVVGAMPDRSLKISILDWEWSGFFPPNNEWDAGLTELLKFFQQANSKFADLFLDVLESHSLTTPRTGGELWDAAMKMTRLIECVNPWWMGVYPNDGGEGELRKMIDEKRESVAKELDGLLDFFCSGERA